MPPSTLSAEETVKVHGFKSPRQFTKLSPTVSHADLGTVGRLHGMEAGDRMLKNWRVMILIFPLAFLSLLLYSLPSTKTLQTTQDPTVTNASVPAPLAGLHCDCEGGRPTIGGETASVCSGRATVRGGGQRVVSYSLFGSKEPAGRAPSEYEGLLPRLCLDVEVQYPGWVIRFYTDYKPEIPEQRKWMCEIQCNHSHVDFCLVDRLPVLGDVASTQEDGTTWRFLPGMDPLVDVFLSRDTDALVIDREREAVREWLDSDSMVHAMRDHPNHWGYILAGKTACSPEIHRRTSNLKPINISGMWGAKTFMDRSLMGNLTAEMLWKTQLNRGWSYDQAILRKVLWPATNRRMLMHDSYFCTKPEYEGPKYRPFPTRREKGDFVAIGPRTEGASEKLGKCPVECRPKNHQDWEYC
ncbi:unnamed protein product [Darwinula stevensoni]|uniref:Uncharacterized protein n=1 Tax=Darwinula stevensoni TaxID=69355 RepID=A0A7R8XBN1_9CRUS|nr:unnamed protein product [Darwinula stevensoni]CAG0891388.1 unnamed protein product [Darwinula stevensoni]